MSDKAEEHGPWPARAAGLAVLGALLALAFERLLLQGPNATATDDPLRLSLAAFAAVFGFALGFTLERVRAHWSGVFALVCAGAVALIFYWNGTPAGWSAGDEWRVFSALLVVAIAAPLFQAARDAGRLRLDPAAVHAQAWTNIVLFFAAWAFVGISLLLTLLLAELFNLIGIDLLREAMEESWFIAAVIGAALGGAIGLLRDRDKVLGNLQRVVTTVLSVLAPVLAAGLVLFVAALPFTGLEPLWDKTRATTPILLFAVAGALVLANAVIGNSAEEEAKGRGLRLSATALAAVMLPLAIVAAISTGLRIDQYGFTPERLWAAVFVGVVTAIAATYLWTVVRGRLRWSERARPANVRLALGVAAVSLLLATPLTSFGAISTRDQLERLEAGEIAPDKFDWPALRFDFGPSGRHALERLGREGPTQVQIFARLALRETNRYNLQLRLDAERGRRERVRNVQVRPAQVPLPPALMAALLPRIGGGPFDGPCAGKGACILFWRPGEDVAVAILDSCSGRPASDRLCEVRRTVVALRDDRWVDVEESSVTGRPILADQAAERAELEAISRGDVQIREVTRHQLFIGGKPVGRPFE